jgi:hypothetical protein
MSNMKESPQTRNCFDPGREALKWIAIATMTIDHIGASIFPQYEVLRIVGRLSFPIFCYLIVLGVESTRSPRNYFLRLLIFAFISQAPFAFALGYQPFEALNIFFTLSFGVLSLTNPLLMLVSIFVSYFLNFDYGPYGIALIALMRILKDDTRLGIALIVLLNVLVLFGSPIQFFSLLALPIILLHKNGYLKTKGASNANNPYPSWRKYFFYIYYPIHLTALYIIRAYLVI